MEEEETSPKLFSMMAECDRRMEGLCEKVVILAGPSKGGLSTAYNWILDLPMYRSGKKQCMFVNSKEETSAARIGNSPGTITKVVNVMNGWKKNTSLIDMGGFNREGDYR
jgi:hypothetical protein